MKHYVSVPLSDDGIKKLQNKLDEYTKWVERKSNELAQRLASLGAVSASIGFSQALYDGANDVTISVQHTGDRSYVVKADGKAVLFIEFGAGYLMGFGHPLMDEMDMGPGTYPGKGHWNDPNGWFFRQDGNLIHSYGNPPNAPMYNAVKNVEQELQRVVNEVFK